MPMVISEMRTGSTFVSEVLSYTLYNKGYHYIRESEWMPDPRSAFAKVGSELVKMHHAHFKDVVVHARPGVGIIVTVRDPLDVYLSATHHLAFAKGWSFAAALGHLESSGWVQKMTERMMSFIDNGNERIRIVPYEKLIAAPVAVLSSALDGLQIIHSAKRLQANCVRFGFSRKTGRKIGDEQANSHERNGAVGQWKDCGIEEILAKRELSTLYYGKMK